MERYFYKELLNWKNNKDRKPLVVKGARQVGKTYIIKEFAKNEYKDFLYIDFGKNPEYKDLFIKDRDPKRIIESLSLICQKQLLKKETLIIFDEIQECKQAIESLKYFYEEENDYDIIAAGSLLGPILTNVSFPVGKVNVLTLNPLSFDEFLNAFDNNLYKSYLSISKDSQIPAILHSTLLDYLNKYILIGGMPECVQSYVNYKNIETVENIKNDLLVMYEDDIAKHSEKINTGRVLLVYRSIPSQLAKENSKFMYTALKTGGRAREFESSIEWLVSAKLVNRVNNVTKIEYPISTYEILDNFKLYFFDTGLLKTMANISNKEFLLNSNYQFKGFLYENFVLQQLQNNFPERRCPFFYSNDSSEIDFLIQIDNNVIPIEVKASDSKKAFSFKNLVNKDYIKYGIRYSRNNYCKDGKIINIPLYLIGRTLDLI